MKGIDAIRRLKGIFDAVYHVSALFPDNTSLTWTMTAHATAHTWSDWTEIADSGATKLSASYTTEKGHITAIEIETLSEIDTIYIYELAWGAGKTVFARGRAGGGTKFHNPITTERFWPPNFPKSQLLYYRMKTATGVADTCTAHIRHHAD